MGGPVLGGAFWPRRDTLPWPLRPLPPSRELGLPVYVVGLSRVCVPSQSSAQ